VERDGLVLIADQGVLTALASTNGNVRWRLPSVGVTGLFFDDHGMLYVNSTTADPDSLKYSRQIDLTKPVQPLIVKLNPLDGTTLWRAESMGAVAHVTGKHVFTVAANPADDGAETQSVLGIRPGAQSGFMRIRCLNAKDGIERWKYDQDRAPLDIGFSGKTVQLLFPNEAQLLRFLAF
jgi:outer membrane protein assembly factor BamB